MKNELFQKFQKEEKNLKIYYILIIKKLYYNYNCKIPINEIKFG